MPDSLTEAAPAKVNLYLHVTGRRADGYHLLDSLVVFAGIGDVLEATCSDTLSLRVEGPFAAGLADEPDNLVLRAARALAAAADVPARAGASQEPAGRVGHWWWLRRRRSGIAAAQQAVGPAA